MAKCVQLLLGFLILTSCSKQEIETSTTLESEWVNVDNQLKSLFDSADIGLVFRKDTLWSTSDRGWINQGQYLIDETEVIVTTSSDTVNWRVSTITTDSLTILADNDTLKYYNRKLEFDPNLHLKKITLHTGLCLGGCESFNVEVDNNGTLEFQGLNNGNVTETHHYVMDMGTRMKIDSLFMGTRISALDSTRFYGWFDDWDMSIKFEYGDGEVMEVKGTNHYMPYRLKPIIGTLINDLRKRELIK